MTITRTLNVCRTLALRPGDRITELDTPDGPFFTVMEITPETFTVDANEAMRPGEDVTGLDPRPVLFGIHPGQAVLLSKTVLTRYVTP